MARLGYITPSVRMYIDPSVLASSSFSFFLPDNTIKKYYMVDIEVFLYKIT